MPEPQSAPPACAEDQTALAERRAAPRHPCNLSTVGQHGGPGMGRTWVATIRDISALGVGLVLRDRLKPGAVFVIKLVSTQHRLSGPLPVRVMHVEPQEGGWLHGCAFLRPVRQDDLRQLLVDEAC